MYITVMFLLVSLPYLIILYQLSKKRSIRIASVGEYCRYDISVGYPNVGVSVSWCYRDTAGGKMTFLTIQIQFLRLTLQ